MRTLARERDRIELVHRLKQVHPESARRWGRMTAHQMVCHLSDAFRMAMSRKPVSHATGPFQRTVQKWIALYLPVPWPPGILTRPEIDQELTGTGPVDFAADLAELESLLMLFATSPGTFDWPEHPIFGRMSEPAWLRWGYLHVDHHLRQFGV
jgi:hypothetical protein